MNENMLSSESMKMENQFEETGKYRTKHTCFVQFKELCKNFADNVSKYALIVSVFFHYRGRKLTISWLTLADSVQIS